MNIQFIHFDEYTTHAWGYWFMSAENKMKHYANLRLKIKAEMFS